jgi:hypothetical protein
MGRLTHLDGRLAVVLDVSQQSNGLNVSAELT